MNKLFTITCVALLLTAIGCQQDNSIVNPLAAVNSQTENPASYPAISASKSDNGISAASSSDLCQLIKVSKVVTMDGGKGGKVKFAYKFPDGSTVDAELSVEKNSFTGKRTFEIQFDAFEKDVELYIDGIEHPDFNPAAHLTLKYKGLDFKNDPLVAGVDWKNATFVYMPSDGSPYQVMDFNKITVDPVAGELFVVDARLPHFSRFGFIR
ncbi:MAG: hypothetical protein CVV24_05110 [Ignavibacteriae bacterium HGW-Ignavibacteriae-3]|nr:MAG: hypothetical protein CVV24_05110 [Ignavibacteriae bacterium HGW-Ignavibacteriae-3]